MWLSDAQWNRIERFAERAVNPAVFRHTVAARLRNAVNPSDRIVTRVLEAVQMEDGIRGNAQERSACRLWA